MIRRSLLDDIYKYIDRDEIIAIKWARQTGKTTILKYIQEDLNSQWEQTIFLNADDIDHKEIFSSPFHLISYMKQFLDFDKKIYLFVDEFQYIDQAWLFLKNIFDKYKWKIKILVSGSSTLEITKNTEFLTGRIIEFYNFPVSFKEYFFYKSKIKNLSFSLENFHDLEIFYDLQKTYLEKLFMEYLSYGGYPAVLTENNYEIKKNILKNITNIYIKKDIINLLKIENITGFNNLLKILASQIWNLLNKLNISNSIDLSKDTIVKYLDILENTFIINIVKPFYKNTKKELSKMPKVFFEDLWIRNVVIWEVEWIKEKIDIGDEVENFVYNELSRKYDKDNLFFYRTVSKAEIDFVIENSYDNYSIIEVKYRNKVWKINIFKKFSDKYYTNRKIVFTKKTLKYDGDTYYIPSCLVGFVGL